VSIASMPTVTIPAISMAAITDRVSRRDRYDVVIGTQGVLWQTGSFR